MRNLLRQINKVAGKTKTSQMVNEQKQTDINQTFTKLTGSVCQKTIKSIQDEQLVYLRKVQDKVPQIEEENAQITNNDDNLLKLYTHISQEIMDTIQLDQNDSKILKDIDNLKSTKNDDQKLKQFY